MYSANVHLDQIQSGGYVRGEPPTGVLPASIDESLASPAPPSSPRSFPAADWCYGFWHRSVPKELQRSSPRDGICSG
jgi:hypothetical protein